MTRRTKDWNKGLAKDLRNPKFAKEFIIASLEEGISLQVVMGKVVRAYGLKEFAERIDISSPNLVRALNPKHNPTLETLNKLLAPFKLTLGVVPSRAGRSSISA